MEIQFEKIIKNGKTNVFVDISWVMYRSYYVFSPDKFKTSQGIPNGHLFGLVQLLRTLVKLDCNIFLCEEGKYNFRKSLSEDYKANRQPSENQTEFWKDYPKIHKLISDLDDVYCLYNENYESDDILFSAAKICSMNGIKALIHTVDKDLYQALDENISILKKVTLHSSEILDKDSDEYKEKFPVEPNKLPYYRAFKGDPSDNLEQPVKRLPKDLTLDLVDYLYKNNSLKGYIPKKKSHEKWIKQLIENWDSYISNYKLMKLNIVQFLIVQKNIKGSYEEVCDYYELNQFKDFVKKLHSNS